MKVLAASFLVSFVVFMLLNVVEDYLNFLVGKKSKTFELPTRNEALRMASILVIFAALQGLFTYLGESMTSI